MAQINLSAWAIRHSTLMHFFMLLVALAGGLMLIYPGTLTDLGGVALIALVVLWQRFQLKKA